jgi:5-deoxy-D-glucuronate isomerase
MNEAIRKFFEELDLIMSEGDTKAALTHLMDSAELIRFAALPQQKRGESKDTREIRVLISEDASSARDFLGGEVKDYAHNQPDCGKMEK